MPIPAPPNDMAQCGATVHEPKSRKGRRKMFRRLPTCAVPGLAPICCDTNDPDTIKCGFMKRLFRKVPVPKPGRLEKLKAFTRVFCQEHINVAKYLTFEEWLGGTSYNDERKAQLNEAYIMLRGGAPSLRQCQHIDTFPKSESYVDWKHTRLINSRSDAFKVFSGPLFKAIENEVYNLPEFVKHATPAERMERVRALRKAGLRYYQTDFTAFESHFTSEVMEAIECELYRHCLPWCRDLEPVVIKTLLGMNKMRTRTGIRASVEARRMSGEMCTSLGNGFTNLVLAKFLAGEQGAELEGLVEGDDGLFATEAHLTADAYAGMGFTIKIEEVADPCAASFCGMVFAESGEVIRDPVKFLATFGWTSSFISAGPKIMLELERAKALSSVYETPQCPIVGALARRALGDTRGVKPRYVDDGYKARPSDEEELPDFHPSPDTRELFARMYGISPSTQMAIEAEFEAGNFNVLDLLRGTSKAIAGCSDYVVDPYGPFNEYASRYLEVG